MAEEPMDYSSYDDYSVKIRNLEEKQRILKERIILIGQNLIETREKNMQSIVNIKKDMEIMKSNMQRLISFLEMVSSEFKNFAKKEDLDILVKQAKMFQSLAFSEKLKNK